MTAVKNKNAPTAKYTYDDKTMSNDFPYSTDRERCLAYLLGEFSSQETTDFEAQLSDPNLAELLLRESELLTELADASALPCPAPTARVAAPTARVAAPTARVAAPVAQVPDSVAQVPAAHSSRQTTWRKSITFLVAIAAVFLLIVAAGLSVPTNQTSPTSIALSEPALDLTVASEWASHANQWTADDNSVELVAFESLDELPELPQDLGIESDYLNDSDLEWITVAFEAFEQLESSNDG